MHKEIEHQINDPENGKPDPNFVAEQSFSKAKAEATYGEKDTVRVDALENRPELRMACIYDPKTGKRGLSATRMSELALAVWRRFEALSLIVIEVKPSWK